jgi:hypothetical protein
MSIIALITWILAAAGGLYLLSIWLIEYDKEFHAAAATRLRPTLLFSHVTLAAGGLVVWVCYLIFDADNLAYTALIVILLAATLGITMAIRWISVYRDTRAIRRAPAGPTPTLGGPSQSVVAQTSAAQSVFSRAPTAGASPVAMVGRRVEIGPPERNFPLVAVIAHGLFAVTTIVLVLLTAFGVGGS